MIIKYKQILPKFSKSKFSAFSMRRPRVQSPSSHQDLQGITASMAVMPFLLPLTIRCPPVLLSRVTQSLSARSASRNDCPQAHRNHQARVTVNELGEPGALCPTVIPRSNPWISAIRLTMERPRPLPGSACPGGRKNRSPSLAE